MGSDGGYDRAQFVAHAQPQAEANVYSDPRADGDPCTAYGYSRAAHFHAHPCADGDSCAAYGHACPNADSGAHGHRDASGRRALPADSGAHGHGYASGRRALPADAGAYT